jgi:5-methylcytosine-specific restriction endonuclease McrA
MAMTYNRGRQSHAWRQLCKAIRAEVAEYGYPCHLCCKPIDLTLHHRHPHSFTVDHVIALGDGGPEVARENAAPCHRSCNTAKENRARSRKKQVAKNLLSKNTRTALRTSRDW